MIHWLDEQLEAQEDMDEYELEMNRAYDEARAEYEAGEIIQFYPAPLPMPPRPEPVPLREAAPEAFMPVPPPMPDAQPAMPAVPPPIPDGVPPNVPQQAPLFQFPPLIDVRVTNHIRNVNVRYYYGNQATTTNNMSP